MGVGAGALASSPFFAASVPPAASFALPFAGGLWLSHRVMRSWARAPMFDSHVKIQLRALADVAAAPGPLGRWPARGLRHRQRKTDLAALPRQCHRRPAPACSDARPVRGRQDGVGLADDVPAHPVGRRSHLDRRQARLRQSAGDLLVCELLRARVRPAGDQPRRSRALEHLQRHPVRRPGRGRLAHPGADPEHGNQPRRGLLQAGSQQGPDRAARGDPRDRAGLQLPRPVDPAQQLARTDVAARSRAGRITGARRAAALPRAVSRQGRRSRRRQDARRIRRHRRAPFHFWHRQLRRASATPTSPRSC